MTAGNDPKAASALAQIARDAAASVVETGDLVGVAIGDPNSDLVEQVEFPLAAIARFLALLSANMSMASVSTANVWLQRRQSASLFAPSANGIFVKVPRATDGAASAAEAGLPPPTCWWSIMDRTVLVYAFTEPADARIAQAIVEEFAIAIEGAELSYRACGAYCDLPAGAQVHHGGSLLDVIRHAPSFPRRLLEVAARCGVTGDADALDVVAQIPATWAGLQILERALSRLPDASEPLLTKVATRAWLRAKGYAEAKLVFDKLPAPDRRLDRLALHDYLRLVLRRIQGDDAAGAFKLYFDDVTHDVRLLEGDVSYPLRIKSETLFNKNHHHEFASTLANEIKWAATFDKTTQRWSVDAMPAPHPHKESLGNKVLLGHTGTLSALGVPRVTRYEFAAAYVRDVWAVDAATRVVAATQVARMRPVSDDKFDTLDFFLKLHREGRIPLATEDDVRRYVMALASPLLRHVAVGLLGIYWILGPPGAGKDFLAELVADVHRHATYGTASPKFTISLTNELEDKRQFFAAGPAIYGRAKEAGKRASMAEQLIRFAGTDQLPARGMRENEISIPNTFTWIAESAEDPPNRIEISRRTVGIHCLYVDDEVSLGQVRQEVLEQAPNIVANLLRKVEEKPVSWYVNQANTKSRPVVPVALAQIFDVKLEEVEGRSLDDLFDAMLIYCSNTLHSSTEGEDQRRIASARKQKEGREACLFRSYRLSHFVDTMQTLPGFKALFAELRTAKAIELLVKREEKRYRDVIRGKARCLEVEIRGAMYAFKLVRSNRNFLLEPLLAYLTTMSGPNSGTAPDAPAPPIDLAAAHGDAGVGLACDEAAESP